MAQSLDSTFPDAPLAVLRTLTEFHEKLDPHGLLLDAYSHILFDAKSELKLKVSSQLDEKTRLNDYITLSTLHMVLAQIFQEQGHWSEDGARNAVFQWRETIRDEHEIRKIDPKYPVSPTLRQRLANARSHSTKLEENKLSAKTYIEAASLAMNTGRYEQANECIDSALKLASPEEKPRLEELKKLAESASSIWSRTTDRRPDAPHFNNKKSDMESIFFAQGDVLFQWSLETGKKPDKTLSGWPGAPVAWANAEQFVAVGKKNGTKIAEHSQ